MNEQNDFQQEKEIEIEESPKQAVRELKRRRRQKNLIFLLILVVVALLAVLCTFSVTYRKLGERYSADLSGKDSAAAALEAEIESLKTQLETEKSLNENLSQLKVLQTVVELYSYYADQVPDDELMEAVLKAYMKATGDKYAEYYTEEEYEKLRTESEGNYEGIGISVLNETLEVEGVEYEVFLVISIFENSPALEAGLEVGDRIYAVKDGDAFASLKSLGGYTNAISKIRGPKGSTVEIRVFRPDGGTYRVKEMSIVRDTFVSQSVTWRISKTNPTVGIVRISEFDLTTPSQLKTAILALQAKGIEKFVFDLRNNPGGDLKSIQATLSYFLEDGDLVLSAIDRFGTVEATYRAGEMQLTGDYAACNVSKEEVGMFHNLSMTVLCNENTASAAEVFVASMRDYELAKIVGFTTYGKGIMQSFIPLSFFGAKNGGYAKMTTDAYVTKCGVTYHEIGITPDIVEELTEEAASYSIYVRPESVDNQLQRAIKELH